VGLVLHLGHRGDPCPAYKGKKSEGDKIGMDAEEDKREWEDVVYVVHSTGVYQ
jgi:hypothetical protein